MPKRQTYMLHIWQSRGLAGEQWVARLECLADGRQQRFADPHTLLEYLQSAVYSPAPEEQTLGDQ